MKIKLFFKINQALLLFLLFFLPFVFVPFFTEPYDMGKHIFLLLLSFLIFIVWTAETISEKKILYKKAKYFFPIFLLFSAFLASTLINSSNKFDSFTTPGGVGTLILSGILYLLVCNFGKRKNIAYSLLIAGGLLSLIQLTLFYLPLSYPLNIPSLNLSLTKNWTPAGNLLSQAAFLFALIPLGISLLCAEAKQKNLKAIPALLLNLLVLGGLGISLYLLNTSAKAVLLPRATAWTIAVEGLKNYRFALFGLGPGQFINAFTAFKGAGFNSSLFWNSRFAFSSNFYFQLLSEIGLIGLASFLLLFYITVKNGIKVFRQPRISPLGIGVYLSLIFLLILQFFIPINTLLFFLLFILLGASTEEELKAIDISVIGKLAFLLLIFPTAFWGILLYFGLKISQGNYYFIKALKSINNKDGVSAYNLLIKAIDKNPHLAKYRIVYSQVNFALANNLAGKKDVSEEDRQKISTLIQQSVREAKSAVALDPRNAENWENLAQLYQNLVNFAEGAENWTITTYLQAINQDPLNPQLRLKLGGFYYSQQNWKEAINLFTQAAFLKPDWANAHYNLANALKESGDFAEAKKEYEITLGLVKVDSSDYINVTKELEDVKKMIPSPTPSANTSNMETLSLPSPAPKPKISPSINLNEDNFSPDIQSNTP